MVVFDVIEQLLNSMHSCFFIVDNNKKFTLMCKEILRIDINLFRAYLKETQAIRIR